MNKETSGNLSLTNNEVGLAKMPKFETDEEFAEWVDTHDTAPFIDEMEDVEEIFIVKRTSFLKPTSHNKKDAPADHR